MNWTLINISQWLKYDDKAYNVFPAAIESHIAGLEGADVAEFGGIKHDVFDEEIFTLVRPYERMGITPEMVMEHCENIALFKKLQHVEMWQAWDQFPLTRNTKVDKRELMRIAETIIEKFRGEGKWNASM